MKKNLSMPNFAVIYSFTVKPGHESKFISGWEGMTELIYMHEGSYGSRLHKDENGNFIGYAVWPDENTWKNYGNNLPDESNEYSKMMKESCTEIKTVFKLNFISDMLSQNIFH